MDESLIVMYKVDGRVFSTNVDIMLNGYVVCLAVYVCTMRKNPNP